MENDLFDAYDSEDLRQLNNDFDYHPRTSIASLKQYAKHSRVAGNHIDTDEISDAIAWLNANRGDLPPEIEGEDGSRGSSQRLEVPYADVPDAESKGDMGLETGLYFVDAACYAPLEQFADESEYLEYGLTHGVRNDALLTRGEAYRRHRDRQAKRLRWRGMQEYRAIDRANELQAKGYTLKPASSGAVSLPPYERVAGLLRYDKDTGVFTRRVTAGRSKAGSEVVPTEVKGQLRVDGTWYKASRLAYLLATRKDPGNNTIDFIDGNTTNLKWDNLSLQVTSTSLHGSGTVRKREGDHKWDAQARIKEDVVTIGTFDTEREAVAAREIFVKAMLL